MKTKERLIYIGAIMLLLASAVLIFKQYRAAQGTIKAKESIIKEKNSTIEYRKNFEGDLIAQKNAAKAELAELKKAYPKLISDVEKRLEVKSKNMIAAVEAKFETQGGGVIHVLHDTIRIENKPDSIGPAYGEIDDGYLKMKGSVKSNGLIDYFDYTYKYSDGLLVSIDRKRIPFKGEEIRVSGVLQNPNATITSIQGAVVEKIRPKYFTISVGVTYDPFGNQFVAGFHAGIPLASF